MEVYIKPGTACMILPSKETMLDAGKVVVVVGNVGKGAIVPVYKTTGGYVGDVLTDANLTCEIDVKLTSAYNKETGEQFLSHFITSKRLMPIEPLDDEEEEVVVSVSKPKPVLEGV